MKIVPDPSCSATRKSFVENDVPKLPWQPSERRLDEEAVSRMDDEGGSNNPAVTLPKAAQRKQLGLLQEEINDTFLDSSQPLAVLAQDYLNALLSYQRHVASDLILRAAENRVGIKEIRDYSLDTKGILP